MFVFFWGAGVIRRRPRCNSLTIGLVVSAVDQLRDFEGRRRRDVFLLLGPFCFFNAFLCMFSPPLRRWPSAPSPPIHLSTSCCCSLPPCVCPVLQIASSLRDRNGFEDVCVCVCVYREGGFFCFCCGWGGGGGGQKRFIYM